MSPAVPTNEHTFRIALQALQEGNPQLALALAQSGPDDDSGMLLVRALALSALAQTGAALPLFEQLTALQPKVSEHWSNLGNALCELGHEDRALAPLQQALALGADDVGTHFALARSFCRLGEVVRADQHIRRARQADPGSADMLLLHARIALASDRIDRARPLLIDARRIVLTPGQRSDLGYLEMLAGQYAEAQQSFGIAIAAMPEDVEAKIGLSLTLERSNRVDEAQCLRDQITPELTDTLTPALKSKLLQLDARLHARSGDEAAVQRCLRTLLAEDLPDRALRANLGFSLGRSLDKTRQSDAAMQAFAQAHATRRILVASSHPELAAQGSNLLTALGRTPPAQRPFDTIDDGETDPLFLVGFPRSGTTLLEQLLDAHPALKSFDEQAFLQHLLDRLKKAGSAYPEILPDLDQIKIGELRSAYFAEVDALVGDRSGLRMVDKNPLNLARLPLVNAVFPRAQVLLALRHPCDVVLSCYMQSFRAPAFAFTFETLLTTARMYAEVMDFWLRIRDGLQIPVHVLRYEDLVADVETKARALFGFLDLPWWDELLAFTERAAKKGAISTPSYSDVTQPVNLRAVGRWQRYRRHFDGDVLAVLQPFVAEFGYRID